MLWTYDRNGERTTYDVCQSPDGTGFELRHKDADGREVVERFSTIEQLNRRLAMLDDSMQRDGWQLAGTSRR